MRRNAVVDVNKKALQQMQETDETLEVARDGLNQPTKPFFKEEDLLYRKWEPRDKEETEPVTQLVLPKECRQKALGLAHSIPLAGHLGNTQYKTPKHCILSFPVGPQIQISHSFPHAWICTVKMCNYTCG